MATVNRRKFLQMAGAQAGALAVTRTRSLRAAPSGAERAQAAGDTADVAVIGAGAFGGWTALYLREMGLSVALIDAYGPGNARAASGGETRQIRAG